MRCSLLMTRSNAWSIVRGWSASAGVFAISGTLAHAPRINTRIFFDSVRMFISPSVGHPKFNSDYGRVIHRLALALCRFEFDLLRRPDCGFVQAMAQTTHYAIH